MALQAEMSEPTPMDVDYDQQNAPLTFNFLDLPKKIRDEVYRYLLTCKTALKEPSSEYNIDDQNDMSWFTTYVDHGVDISITAVNRQIRDEALAVMSKENLFVRVTSADPGFCDKISEHCVPVLAIFCPAREFPTPSLDFTYYPQKDAPAVKGVTCFILLTSHLDRMLKPMSEGYIQDARGHYALNQLRLMPFPGASVGLEIQQQLLAPFLKYLSGYQGVHLTGPWDSQLARTAVDNLTGFGACLLGRDIVNRMARVKHFGNELYAQGSYRLAIKHWVSGYRCLNKLEWRGWRQMLPVKEDGVDPAVAFAKLYFVLWSNCSVAAWEIAKANRDNDLDLSQTIKSMKAFNIMAEQLIHDPDLQTLCQLWSPSKAQLAKLRARVSSADQLLTTRGLPVEHPLPPEFQ